MVKEAVFKYKCRRCGKVFGNLCTAPKNGELYLIEATIHGRSFSHQSESVTLLRCHNCGDSGCGVGDLIGCDIEGEDEVGEINV